MDPRIAITRIGDAYMSLNDFENAESNYTRALSFGYDKFAYLGMAKINTRLNRMDEALKILTMLVEKEPGDLRISGEFRAFVKKYPQAVQNINGPVRSNGDE
jgi:tetratricopeptide (TPR) repeat protein